MPQWSDLSVSMKQTSKRISLSLIVTSGFALAVIALMSREIHKRGWLNLAIIEIKGLKTLTREEILTNLTLPLGTPLRKIDPTTIELTISRFPVVESVIVYKRYPSRLIIAIKERTPLAVIYLPQLQFIDRWGKTFPIKPGESIDYPILTLNIADNPLQSQIAHYPPMTTMALALLSFIRANHPFLFGEISEIAISNSSIRVFLRPAGTEVLVKSFDDTIQWSFLEEYLKIRQNESRHRVTYVDISIPGKLFEGHHTGAEL
ncbi:MAG: cell division protein FtsQ/DivIB [bacterium]